MPISNVNAGTLKYLDACCGTFKEEKLGKLLSNDVKMIRTSGGIESTTEGKDAVLTMYIDNLFEITSKINLLKIKFEYIKDNQIQFTLSVEETKENYGGVEGKSRWKFTDDTSLTFKKTDEGHLIINKIESSVVRILNDNEY